MPFDVKSVASIIMEARSHEAELPWIEFKTNWDNPQDIGEYISALSNMAALFNQPHGFLIWGIDDKTHEIVGTSFDPQKAKRGGQDLGLWIATQLEPQVQFYFHKTIIDEKPLVLLEIAAAYSTPVKFRGVDYIRIDSHQKKLKDFPDTERELWAVLSRKPFETLIALENVPADLVLRLLDYSAYFDLLSAELPSGKQQIIAALIEDHMIAKNEAGSYNI